MNTCLLSINQLFSKKKKKQQIDFVLGRSLAFTEYQWQSLTYKLDHDTIMMSSQLYI